CQRWIPSAVVGSAARAVAERGNSSRSAISPKTSPGPSVAIFCSFPSRSWTMSTLPERMMNAPTPVSPWRTISCPGSYRCSTVACGYAPEDPSPAGFVFGFRGIHDYPFRHHSHVLAVRDHYRGSGLAQQLKEAQRDHCLDQGIEIVAWTMDPLEARNARFNFGKLGAYTRTYHRDFYGAMPDKLNQGLPSDRIYVEWPIGHERTYKRLRGEDQPAPLEDAESEGIAYLLRADGDRPGGLAETTSASHLLVEIP